MMISFVPTIYEDEILYSFISRYHQRSGNIRINDTLQDLFSIPYLKSNRYLPGYIANLVGNFPINCEYTIEDIILNNTLYPFFTFFDSDEFSNEIFNLMSNSNNNDIRSKSGIINTKMNPIYFKFCNECMKEDLDLYGEMYWHRIHQTPGVLVCHKHNTILYNSNVKINKANIIEYIAPNKDNCVSNYKIEYSENIKQQLYELSKSIEFIMNVKFNKKTIDWYKNNYINALMIKNLATINGNLKVDSLIKEFKEYYTDEFLNLIGCNIDENTYNNWLLDIFRKPRQRYHTIKHLLIIKFLGYSIEEIINNEIKYKPFGDAPWPCLNKVCDKYMIQDIDDVNMIYYPKEDKLVGTFTCDRCGFTYSRRGPDIDKINMYEISKIKDLGDLWRSKLIELVLYENITITDMEKILNVDKGTIYRNAKKLSLPIYTRIDNNKSKEVNRKIDNRKSNKNYREIWIELIKNNPDKPKTGLKNLDKATYFWLYNNDRIWLDEVSPKTKKSVGSTYKIIDWEKRDSEVLKLIKNNIKVNLNSDIKPEKISINSIARIINKPLLYYLSTNKMPKTKKYVDSILDNIDSYAKKKIIWSVNYINNHDNEELTINNIIKIANISRDKKLKHIDYIKEFIN